MSEEQKPSPTTPEPKMRDVDFDFNQIVHELWNGKLPLFQVFWLYYFAVLFVLKVLGDMMGVLASVFALFELVWAIFMIKPVIIAANQYEGPKHWALGAKAIAILMSGFVLLDVVAKMF